MKEEITVTTKIPYLKYVMYSRNKHKNKSR